MGVTSPDVDAFMEFPGIETSSIEDPAVRRAFGVINEYFKREGVFSDQDAKQTTIDANVTTIAANETAITANEALNSTHRDGNGSDHADVASNTTHRSSNGSDHADVASNTTHRSSNGSDHSDVVSNTTHRASSGADHAFIDQDVKKAASVQFAALKFGASGQQVTDIDTDTSLGTSDSKLATQKAIKAYVDAQVATKMDDALAALQVLNVLKPNSSAGIGIGDEWHTPGGDVKWRVV